MKVFNDALCQWFPTNLCPRSACKSLGILRNTGKIWRIMRTLRSQLDKRILLNVFACNLRKMFLKLRYQVMKNLKRDKQKNVKLWILFSLILLLLWIRKGQPLLYFRGGTPNAARNQCCKVLQKSDRCFLRRHGGCDHQAPKPQFAFLFRNWGYKGFNWTFLKVAFTESLDSMRDFRFSQRSQCSSFKQQGITASCHIPSNSCFL
jgi:hypothetical protein